MSRDQETQRWLDRIHAERQRAKFGVAAIGCALVLAGCGGGDDSEEDHAEPPKPRVDCRVSGACL